MAVDNLCSLANVKTILGPASEASSDAFLNLLISEVSNEITRSCGRTHFLLSNSINPITQFYAGAGEEWLALNQWPVYTPLLLGDCVAGSATITNMASTSYLFTNQSVTGLAFQTTQPNVAPAPPLYITQIPSATSVVVSGAATTTAMQQPIGFGVGVWSNYAAFAGGVSGAFQLTNMLGEGANYWIDRDQPDGTCKSGLLGGIWTNWPCAWAQIHADLAPTQLPGFGNIQVQAAFGYSALPPDLEMAAIWAVLRARQMTPMGELFQSESDDGYSYSRGDAAKAAAGAVAAVNLGILDKQIAPVLARYRIGAFGR